MPTRKYTLGNDKEILDDIEEEKVEYDDSFAYSYMYL